MSYASLSGRARTSSTSPQAHAICDRCGARYNHVDLTWQVDWAGSGLINKRMLVCPPCYDTPQQQLRAIVLPADPMPIMNPRVQDFAVSETNYRMVSGDDTVDPTTGIPIPGNTKRKTQDNDFRVLLQTGEAPQGLNEEPGTDPNAPGNDDPGLPYNNTEVPKTGPLNG